MHSSQLPESIARLEQSLGTEWSTLRECTAATENKRLELSDLLQNKVERLSSTDTSFVIYGSLARGEWTSGSDLDWTFLVDGQANSDHLQIAHDVRRVLREAKFVPPGPTGTFGDLTFSHELVHKIGGVHDTNINTTQRILLLLESTSIPVEARGAYDRIVRAVLNRYLEEDERLINSKVNRFRVPRFLLNDIVRFWRTMAVDFASKQRDREGQGWGIRNAKLRMSRKLIFAAGLLICFSCVLDDELNARIGTSAEENRLILVDHLRKQSAKTPLELLGEAVEKHNISSDRIRKLFDSYDQFLAILSDEAKRNHLKQLRVEDAENSEIFHKEVRPISTDFQLALNAIFLENDSIGALTRRYAIF